MPGDLSHHCLIARPQASPATHSADGVDCTAEDCPNIGHTSCLGSNTILDCCEIKAQSAALGITASLVFQEVAPDSPQGEADPSNVDTHSDDDAWEHLQLEPSTLVTIIRKLRMELQRKRSSLSYFDTTFQGIAQQPPSPVLTSLTPGPLPYLPTHRLHHT